MGDGPGLAGEQGRPLLRTLEHGDCRGRLGRLNWIATHKRKAVVVTGAGLA